MVGLAGLAGFTDPVQARILNVTNEAEPSRVRPFSLCDCAREIVAGNFHCRFSAVRKNPLILKKIELEEQIIGLEKSKANRLEPLRKRATSAKCS
jgi:hypothetical protein